MDYSAEEKWDLWTRKAYQFESIESEKTDMFDDYIDWAVERWMAGIITIPGIEISLPTGKKKMAKADKSSQILTKKNIAKAASSGSQDKQKANG